MVMMQTIWPLASQEYSESVQTGDKRSQHRRALTKLLHLLGGLHRLPLLYRELLVHFYSNIAIVSDVSTEINPTSWDPGPWRGEGSDPAHSVASELSATSTSTTDADTLSEILAALRELVTVEDIKRQGTWTDEDHLGPIFRWTHLRRIALKMRLWNLLHSNPPEAFKVCPEFALHSPNSTRYPPPKATLEICLCLAAQLFIYLGLETHGTKQPWYMAHPQYAEMLERIKALDSVLLRCMEDLDLSATMEDSFLDAIAKNGSAGQKQARDLLWITAVGACFE